MSLALLKTVVVRCQVFRSGLRSVGTTTTATLDEYRKITKRIQSQKTGIQFPSDLKGARSTQSAGKCILSAAFTGAMDSSGEGVKYAALVEAEQNWRFNYKDHFMNLVRLSAKR